MTSVVSTARAQSKNDVRKKVFFSSLSNTCLKNSKKTADSLSTRRELSNDALNVYFTQTDEKLAGGVIYYPLPHLVVKGLVRTWTIVYWFCYIFRPYRTLTLGELRPS